MEIKGMEKVSLVDYESKIACTIFLGGCNFRCPFCQNSSLVLNPSQEPNISIETFLDYLVLRKKMLNAVCITGGEPTLSNDLEDLIVKIKKLDYLVKLDTNGSNPKVLKELVEKRLIDYVAMDVKNSYDSYPKTIGVKFNLDNIKESINFLINGQIDYEFRTTLVQEFHKEEDIVNLGNWLNGAKILYLQKFVDSANTLQKGLHEIDIVTALKYKDILKNNLCEVKLRGY